jgi:hypothetical protein
MSRANGPGEFFARHPVAYSLSLSGAGAAVGIFASRAARSRGPRRLGWILLSALEAMTFVGIIVVTRQAKKGRFVRRGKLRHAR